MFPDHCSMLQKPHGAALVTEKQIFNKTMTKLHVCNENCIGMLKVRFQSLKELPFVLRGERDTRFICEWIMACVLQNFFVKR